MRQIPVYLRDKKFKKKFSQIQKTTYLYRRCEVILRKMWEKFEEYCKYILIKNFEEVQEEKRSRIIVILYRTGNMQSAILLSFVASSSLPLCGLQSTHPLMPCYISPYIVYNVYTSLAVHSKLLRSVTNRKQKWVTVVFEWALYHCIIATTKNRRQKW